VAREVGVAEDAAGLQRVVLVHGGWHGAWCWDAVADHLQRRRITVNAVNLPLDGFPSDVQTVRSAIQAAGPVCVVLGHSYGGLVMSEAAAELSNISRLIYLAAFMTRPQEDWFSIMAGSRLPDALIFDESGTRVDPSKAGAIFYGDSPPDVVANAVSRLRPMRNTKREHEAASPIGPAWRSIPSTYVVCTNDCALPPESQRTMAARADAVLEWPTDHSPFLTRPEAIGDLIMQYID
jgi:pimeloyl-ACP methyl ester carboxylesterase